MTFLLSSLVFMAVFGAVLVGGFAFAFVMMITAMIFGKD